MLFVCLECFVFVFRWGLMQHRLAFTPDPLKCWASRHELPHPIMLSAFLIFCLRSAGQVGQQAKQIHPVQEDLLTPRFFQ